MRFIHEQEKEYIDGLFFVLIAERDAVKKAMPVVRKVAADTGRFDSAVHFQQGIVFEGDKLETCGESLFSDRSFSFWRFGCGAFYDNSGLGLPYGKHLSVGSTHSSIFKKLWKRSDHKGFSDLLGFKPVIGEPEPENREMAGVVSSFVVCHISPSFLEVYFYEKNHTFSHFLCLIFAEIVGESEKREGDAFQSRC